MPSKSPSSLDYDGHLHELALANWRRAILDENVARAETNAAKLAASHDKFWRFIGGTHVAIARLGSGHVSLALDALAQAIRTYSDAHELVSLAQALSAHVYLQVRSPRQALEVLEGSASTLETRYWRALALARLDEGREADTQRVATGDALLERHVAFARGGALDDLMRHAPLPPPEQLASTFPFAPVHFEIGVALAEKGRLDDALARFECITGTKEVLLYWPIPYIRGLYQSARLKDALGRTDDARAIYARFLNFWKDAEIDRADVADARQSTSA